MKSKKITVAELAVLLAEVKGNPIASIEMVTKQHRNVSKVEAKKRGLNPNEFFKFTKMAVQLGSTYTQRVNNQKAKEGLPQDFEAKLGNVIRVSGALGCGAQDWNRHMNYAILTPNRNQKTQSFYMHGINKVDDNFIREIFIPSAFKTYKSNTQGVKDDIYHITVKLSSITALVSNRVRYEVIQGR